MSSGLKAERLTVDFNQGWKFQESDITTESQLNYDEGQWQQVTIPHDWAFNKGISEDGAQKDKGGYFDGGIGWYRRTFEMRDDWRDKRVMLEFQGVYMNSEVWINGHYLGKKAYGYISFRHDLSNYLKPGLNHIAVRVDSSSEPSARWYHPAGIYAPVSLIVTDKHSYIEPNGVYVSTEVKGNDLALANIQYELTNQSSKPLVIESTVVDAAGTEVAVKRQALTQCMDKKCLITSQVEIDKPHLWSTESPSLYTLKTAIQSKGKTLDVVETTFGVRTIQWDTDTGFWLNGVNTKLLGVSEHWEGGPVGGAWTKALLRWKLSLFKEMGVNAIRTAHNPYPPMFYELCDELGFLVMDEIFDGWHKKAPFDYGHQAFASDWEEDLTEWVKRNRNHPSVVIYSVGNETRGDKIAEQLVAKMHELDPSRPVTSGHSASKKMDVYGVNGGSEKRQFFSKPRPNKPFVSTEAPHTWQTRGYYRSKTWLRDGNRSPKQGVFELPDLTEKEIFTYEWANPESWRNRKQHFNSSYDNATVRISARKNWELMRDLPWFSGHFRWTGFDYYGEAGYVHGGWPFRLFMGGALDVAGFKKDLFYFYKSQWTDEPFVHLLPHWTHPRMAKGTAIPVWAYSNCEEVELFINGQSLGRDIPGTQWDEMQAEWVVPWQEGQLKANCYIKGEIQASTEHNTAAAPTQLGLKLEGDYINPQQDGIAVITADLLDGSGHYYPYGENKVYYHVAGSATIRSLENGDPVDTAKNVGVNNRKAFMGATRAFLDITDLNGDLTLLSGAILGDKHLYTSSDIHINVQQLAIIGNKVIKDIGIYYTTDGSTPSRASKAYQGSFKVAKGTTVKAAVFAGDLLVFQMTETFGDGSGLYWANSPVSNYSASYELGAMPARDAKLVGAIKRKDHVDFKGQEGSITWYQENDGEYGMNQLAFEYALNDKRKTRYMDLYVNGKKVKTLKFKNTGSWHKRWKKIKANAPLGAGANYIELRTKGNSGPNIKSLSITK